MEEAAAVLEVFTEQLRGKLREARDFDWYEHVAGFNAAVDWKEPWLVTLLVAHAFLLLFTLRTRKQGNTQTILFFLLLTAIYLAEPLNTFLRRHWQSFSGQNYFDKHGVFLSVVYSGPLLIVVFVNLVNMLITTSEMLIRLKRTELQMKRRKATQNGTNKPDTKQE